MIDNKSQNSMTNSQNIRLFNNGPTPGDDINIGNSTVNMEGNFDSTMYFVSFNNYIENRLRRKKEYCQESEKKKTQKQKKRLQLFKRT